ncbi:hypothetical protein BDB00DRAFT_795176 [Zychaea mexicana]|uniref:uncharacterized protein n=1 Tax=Zychaea mexicana TaxID=64656 RepID=UPI0022FE1313|nr:uncharacterized protein BDB00DRAFT_795176 [Zychaea mexicana]KAI9499704.1 hypothetical protein BDB00DRAFT_795176 [Zychaea mexicana]
MTNLRLPNLKNLLLCSKQNGFVETNIWKSIPCNAPLTRIQLLNILAMGPVFDLLIDKLPPQLDSFRLAFSKESNIDWDFIRLFRKYANVAATTPATKKSQRRPPCFLLKTLALQDCQSVTDQVLSTAGDISTLTTVMLHGPFPALTSNGIKQLVKKLFNVEMLAIGNLDVVTDGTLIGSFDNYPTPYLQTLKLQSLRNVTDYGVIIAVDSLASSLKRLKLIQCRSITQTAFEYAKRRCAVYDKE